MSVTEKRTQIYLTADQHSAVQRLARRRGTSMAGVIREAVAEYLAQPPDEGKKGGADPLADLIGITEGTGDLAARHDDYLYGKPRRRKR